MLRAVPTSLCRHWHAVAPRFGPQCCLGGLRKSIFAFARYTPRQQLLDAIDRMLGNAREQRAQIGLGIEPVEFGRADQTIDRRGALATRIRAREQIVLAPQSDRA